MNRNVALALAAVTVILITGVVLSQFSSSDPDGLEYVSQQQGFDDAAQDHTLDDAALADYGENLDQGPVVGTAVAAITGLAATAIITVGLLWLVRGRHHDSSRTP